MQLIHAANVPAPGGHYSHAVSAAGLIFVSGILPGRPAAGETDDFERQVRATLEHGKQILAAAGASLNDVVQCTAYIAGVEYWPEFNTIYAEIFGQHKPARAVVPVPELHHGFLVEIQLVAQQAG